MLTQISLQKKICFGLLFLLLSVASNAQISSDFATSSDSWVYLDASSGSNSTPAYSSTGGNPNGNISVTTSSGLVGFYWIAPSKFIGNLSSSYNQNLTFDIKVSTAGTDNSVGDVIMTNSATGANLYYQLGTKPSAGSWSPYSVQFNESQWHNGCPTCSAPDQITMKQTLSNVTKIQIRLKYLSGNTFPYTSQLDNVVLNSISSSSIPSITSISPTSGLAGTSVTITGSNFNTTASQNRVYFKGISATVTNATATQLTVTVPTSACFGPITAVNLATGLQGVSAQSFNPLFDNNKDYGGRIIPSTMAMGYSTILPTNNAVDNKFGNMDKGDLDGDGWIDFVSTETSTAKIYAFRNLGTGGTVSASSFAAAQTLPSLSSIPGGGASLSEVVVADVDSDGKLDIAASTSGNYGGGKGFLAVYRNTSTVGSISFASPVFFPYNYYSALYMATGDLDGDGRSDFAFTTGSSPGNVFICQNFSTPGNIDFSFGASISAATTSGYSDIVIGDLTGDGKPEIVSPGYNATTLSIYQNNSSPGTISMGSPFTIPAIVSYTVQLAMTDLDADNKQDMVWSVYGASKVYFTKNLYSGGTFDASSFGAAFQVTNNLSNPLGMSVGDINADGKPDVLMSGYSDLAILQNVGTAGNLSASSFNPTIVFQGSSPVTTNIFGLSPVVADVDGDNKPEAAFVSSGGGLAAGTAGVYIFHNESSQPPQITAINPSSAPSGSTITVTGNYLYTTNTTPKTSGIGITTTPSNVSNTSLQINVPTGFADNRISATIHGLQAFSPTQFYSQLNGGLGGAINSSTFGTSVDFNLSAFASNPGLAVADLDGDGKPDIIIDDNGTSKIYANTLSAAGSSITSGSFTLQAGTLNSASHLKVTDLDGDGILDVVTNGSFFAGKGISPNPISFGSSSPTPLGNTNRIIVNHDFNLDGKPEVVISNTSNQILVYENFTNKGAPYVYSGGLASLSTTPLTYGNAATVVGLAAGDFDGDGFEDIAYGVASGSLSILLNSGSKQIMTASQFTGPTTFTALSTPQYITTADFNGDGKLDLAMGYYSTSAFISVYINNSTVGSLNFARQDFASPAYCNGIEVGDIDGDGKPEIVSINNPSGSSGSISIFRNTSSGGTLSLASAVTYSLGSPSVPTMLALADVNLDNKTDIIISRTGSSGARLSIFQNLITFPTTSISPQPTSAYSVCDGATPTISTSASGTTNLIYQWQIFNSGTGGYNDLTNTGGYSNVSTSSLTINTTGNFGTGTYRCKINGDYAATVYTNTVSFTVNPVPSAPTAGDVNFCPSNTVLLTASGGSNGNYIWYDQSGVIGGQTNSTYTTPSLSATTPYSVAITNGNCTSTKTNLNAVAQTIPSAPTASDVNFCPSNTVLLTASGGSNGNYIWYDQNGAINGQTNSTYTTPTLSSTTPYSVAITNGNCTSTKTNLNAVAQTVPSAPTASDVNFCPSNTVLLTASGGSNGNYIWYDQSGVISGQTNSTYTTPTISATTSYSVAITNGNCASAKTNLNATAQPIPAAPTASDVNFCSSSTVLLTASGGSNGNYIWYDQNGSVINGQINSTYTTPVLANTTAYSVAITNAMCTSSKASISAVLISCGSPVITSEPLSTNIGGKITLDLKPLISTPGSTLNLASLQIITPPSSGATASIDANGILTLDYNGKPFAGAEQITIKACDAKNQCATQNFSVDVIMADDIVIYNGISPDGANPKLILQYIEILPETKSNRVSIFDRWENLVWHGTNYDNNSVVFTGSSDSGNALPSGVYFYKIEFASGRSTKTGFISLRR